MEGRTMKNKRIIVIMAIALIIASVNPAKAEKWGPDEFGLSLAYYGCDENGNTNTDKTGSYVLGDYFYFEYDLWIHGAEGKRAVYKINLMVDQGMNAEEIKNFQYFNGSTWADASAFRGTKNDTKPLKTLTGNIMTRFRVRFNKNTTYKIEASCVGENNEFGITSERYIVLENGTYTVSKEGHVEELTTEESATVQPTAKEPSTELKSAFEKGADEKEIEQAILNLKDDNDPQGSTYGLLQLKQKSTKKKSIKIIWKKVKGAKKYVIYGNRCGRTRRYKKITSTKKKTYTYKKLKKGTYYKFMVVAFDQNNKVLTVSKLTHIITKGGKYGNDKAVKTKAKKDTVTLNIGKRFNLKGKEVPQSKKLKVNRHRIVKYESDNPKIAAVNAKGVIRGIVKGKCHVYAYAQNGISRKIKVTIK